MVHAVVILYNGSELDSVDIARITNVLSTSTHIVDSKCTITTMSEEEIKAVLASRISSINPGSFTDSSKEQKAIDAAVTFIGERFIESLSRKDLFGFTTRITTAVERAKYNNTDISLLKAVKVLSTHEGKIPAHLCQKYNFTKTVLDIVQKVYKLQGEY